uniref:C2H2-type domain-containing protein n=1 Tax=Rhizophora mucronata TaxID=61149 RepID=A0A2P2K4K2_RHIMU
MDAEANLPIKTLNTRHTCSACYKQFNKKEHLVEHMKISYHSPHQPICGVCQKHCKSYESLREHLAGPLAKANCSKVFSHLGCNLCLKIFDSSDSLSKHRGICCLSAPGSLVPKMLLSGQSHADISSSIDEGAQAVAIDCEMVGGGSDGSVDLCARVCLVDEDENVVFNTYIQPQNPVTNYRYFCIVASLVSLENKTQLNFNKP